MKIGFNIGDVHKSFEKKKDIAHEWPTFKARRQAKNANRWR